MTLLKYREAEYERMREVRVVRRIARHRAAKNDPRSIVLACGRIIVRTEREAECEGCRTAFRFEMTTKPHRFCDDCKTTRRTARDRGRKR